MGGKSHPPWGLEVKVLWMGSYLCHCPVASSDEMFAADSEVTPHAWHDTRGKVAFHANSLQLKYMP